MEIQLKSSEESHYTVYKLTDPEGKVYIGYTGQRIERRWCGGHGYEKGTPIREAIIFYGWKNFNKEILCEKLTKEGAEKLEGWFVEYYDSMNPENGYNRFSGGAKKGSFTSEAMKEKDRKSKLALYDCNPDFCRLYSESLLAYYRKHPEAKSRIAMQVSEYLRSPEGRKFVLSCTKAKPVRCVETGEEYPSQHAAEKATGHYGIHKACSGLQTYCGGYHWKYIIQEGT